MTKKLLSLLIGIVFTLFASLAHAVPPQNGWWWNPSESGSGYAIERQGNSIFMASFLYEPSGAATWYVSSLTLGSDGSYRGDMLRYTGGKSLLGSYKAPTSPTLVASVAISFQHADTGTMVINFSNGAPSRTVTINRFGFGTPTAFAPSGGTFQSGWYWNAAESGTGYFIEMQGTQAFIASFMYDTEGQPTWYVSVANLQGKDGLSGPLTRYINGQSLGGAYKTPAVSGDAGTVSYKFGSTSSGMMALPNGASVPLTRFAFDSTYTTNTPPVANAGSNQSVTVGTQVSLSGSGTDSNGDQLKYYWSYLAAPAESNANLYDWATANPIFTPDLVGTYQFGLIVDDGKASSPVALVTINATNTNTSSNGCGPATYTPNLPPMIDSLGNPVDESTFAGGDSGAAGGDGTAGDGAPIANAPVTITDANGKTVSTTTDALGYYRVSLKCMTAPFIAKVTRADGNVWYSASTTSPIQRGFVTMNLTALTDKVSNNIADAMGISGGAAALTPNAVQRAAGLLPNAVGKVVNGLASPIISSGLDPLTFNPITTSYAAVKTNKYDNLLDTLAKGKVKDGTSRIVGTFAGDGVSYLDGDKSIARFSNPTGLVIDKFGNIYMTDTYNNSIRKLSPDGIVSTIAGDGSQGYSDAIGKLAKFNQPRGITIDSNNNLFVTDTDNDAIRKITPQGVVTTFAGGLSGYGFKDAVGSAAKFNYPYAITIDSNNNLYIADAYNNAIRKISPQAVVTTLAGSGTAGRADGNGFQASFNFPSDLAIDLNNNIYVADTDNNLIRKISPNGFVSTIVGNGKCGFQDGFGIEAQICFPTALSVDNSGKIYFVDMIRSLIRMVDINTRVITLSGGDDEFIDGPAATAKFYMPMGIKIDKSSNLIIADTFNAAIRSLSVGGTVTTLAGKKGYGLIDGQGLNAKFKSPHGLSIDLNNNIYVADNYNNSIRKISPNGQVTTIAGNGARGDVTGLAKNALFFGPKYVLHDPSGDLYISDTYNNKIKILSPNGIINTFAGSGALGYVNGPANIAQFTLTKGMAKDKNGNLFVVDSGNNAIRKVDKYGMVTTFAGGSYGQQDGQGENAKLSDPEGLVIDSQGNFYVSQKNNIIRKITANGWVSTFAGTGVTGYVDGNGNVAQFDRLNQLSIDKFDNIYVAETGNNEIRKINPAGFVTSLIGNRKKGVSILDNSPIDLNSPRGVVVSNDGNIYISDTLNNSIRVILP
jgi:hypothetical protein